MKKSKNLKILFLDILTGDRRLRRDIEATVYNGTTPAEHMRKFLGLAKNELVGIDGSKKDLPKPEDYDAIIIGGSLEDPIKGQEKLWMKKVYKFIRLAIKKEVPILGICGGLQFTVRALGGSIVLNPKGREFGGTIIDITSKGRNDPLFRGLPKKNILQSSHKCIAKNLKPDWLLLASSGLCRAQAIAIGGNIRLLQFHPEMTGQQVAALARMRKADLVQEGFLRDEQEWKAFLVSIKSTKRVGKKILKNFLVYFIKKRMYN